uniref:Uncharacterized protein n=1 Tax=Leersia perrieri TaxID=77586 RepID=A0A0D9V4K3_9ORYZ
MADNPNPLRFRDVIRNAFHLMNNADDARILLAAADQNVRVIDARMEQLATDVGDLRHELHEVMNAPMSEEEREAQRLMFLEILADLDAEHDLCLEQRRRLMNAIVPLIGFAIVAITKRALWRYVPIAFRTFAVGAAGVVIYNESRRGAVPLSRNLLMVLTRLALYFL